MPAVKKRRLQFTNQAGLIQPIFSTRNTANNTDSYDSGYFPLQRTLFPIGTPSNSKQSRAIYSDLAEERQFLIHLKQLWNKKLQDLKEDEKFLYKMKDMTKEELEGIGPLFPPSIMEIMNGREDTTAVTTDTNTTTVSSDNTALLPPQPITFDSTEIINNEAEMLSTLDNLQRLIQENRKEESLNDEEDEARKALNILLQELGDTL